MPGKFKESDVLFAHVIQNADRAEFFAGKPDDLAPRTAELALERLHPPDRRVEMLLEKFFENVHQDAKPSLEKQGTKTFTFSGSLEPEHQLFPNLRTREKVIPFSFPIGMRETKLRFAACFRQFEQQSCANPFLSRLARPLRCPKVALDWLETVNSRTVEKREFHNPR